MVEECCDAAYFRSEMTGRDAGFGFYVSLSLLRSSHQGDTRYGRDLFGEKPMKSKGQTGRASDYDAGLTPLKGVRGGGKQED